jgi:hypothetical protein
MREPAVQIANSGEELLACKMVNRASDCPECGTIPISREARFASILFCNWKL